MTGAADPADPVADDVADEAAADDVTSDDAADGVTTPEAGAEAPGERSRWSLLATVAAVVLVLDQLTKWWAVSVLDDEIIHVIWTLQLQLTYNTGSAFSLAQGRGAIISILALVAVLILLRTGRTAKRTASVLALGLIVGGALGNLIDRAFREGEGFLGGGVVDFIDLQWWPVFNLADTAVVVGAGLLVAASWRDESTWQDEPTRRPEH